MKLLQFSLFIIIPILYANASTEDNTLSESYPNNEQFLNSGNDNQVFIENKGQWPEEVRFLAKVNGMNVWITKSGIIYDFFKYENDEYYKKTTKELILSSDKQFKPEGITHSRHVVKMSLVNGNKSKIISGLRTKKGYHNYFLGNDPSKWASHVPIYKEVRIEEIYEGIDVKFYFDDGSVRYDFLAAPNADISQINLAFEGQDKLSVNSNGELLVHTSLGNVEHKEIFAYQDIDGERKEVECSFDIENGAIMFKTGGYKTTEPLVIDPLVYSTFIGGSGTEYSIAITADDDGYAYISGNTASSDFPVTTGSYQTTKNSSFDTFISKINPSGTELIFSTFIGGSSWDRGDVIKTDGEGNIYIIGWTYSNDYPVTLNAFQTAHGGGWWCDAVVTKLNPEGSNLEYSTYLGGNYSDVGYGGEIDENGYVYVTGNTLSTNFHVTTGAFQNSRKGDRDCFITKFNPSGTGLEYSTYVGGEDYDCAYEIDVDSYGNAYITGYTKSADYPVTQNVIQTQLDGAQDAFVTKLNSTGTNLIYSSYFGGSKDDTGISLDLEDDQYAFVVGYTSSTDYPSTQDVYQSTYGGGDYDCFVTKFNASASGLIFSTYLGGSGSDDGYGISIDNAGNILVTGNTISTDFPVSNDALQSTLSGTGEYGDCYVTKFNTEASEVLYSTYLGGSYYEMAWEVTNDNNGNIYVTGYTGSSDFLISDDAYQVDINTGIPDCFVTKFNICNSPVAICNDVTVYLDDDGEATITVEDINDGSTADCGLSDISISQESFDCYDIGRNSVTLTATDYYGNTDECVSIVTVIDNTPPDISISVNPTELWPPNHKMKSIEANVTVSDNCPDAVYYLESITSNEPDNGLGDGDKDNDIQNADYETNDINFDLRAERSGKGNGRIYTITYRSEDGSGNSAKASATVSVPKNNKRESVTDLVIEETDYQDLVINCQPNPASNNITFNIYSESGLENASLILTDISGNMIMPIFEEMSLAAGNNVIRCDLEGLPSGAYYYTIRSGSFSTTKLLNIIK